MSATSDSEPIPADDQGFAAIHRSALHRRSLLKRGLVGASLLPSISYLGWTGEALAAQDAPSLASRVPTGVLKVANPGEPNFLDPPDALEITELGICRNV